MTNILLLNALEKSVFWHGWWTILIFGLIFLIIGFFIGWLVWRHCKRQALQIEELNTSLEEKITALEKLT